MKKLIKLIIFVISLVLLYFVFDYIKTTKPRIVNFQELDEFRQYVLTSYNVDKVDIYFSRPRLIIEINSKKKLSKENTEKIKEKLKRIINKENMDIISEKYWAKDTSLYYVNILFNEEKENIKINYIKIELSQSKAYEDWN